MATTMIERRALRLATDAGQPVVRPAKPVRPFTEADIEREAIESFERWEGELPDESDLKLILTTLGAEFRRRQARRRARGVGAC